MQAGGFTETKKDFWEELVASNPEPRNWRANIISILVILGVLVLVVFSVFCLTPTDPGPRVQGEKIRLDDVLNGKFKPNPFNATWQKGSSLYYMNKDGGLSCFDLTSGDTTERLDNTTFRRLNYVSWSISEDENFVMILHDRVPVFRHSSLAKYTLVNLQRRFSPLLKIGKSWASESASLESQDHLQHAQFLTSKEGETGVIFVDDNDIYYIPSLNNSSVFRLTETGEAGTLYNGVADWLYEEEILAQSPAIFISTEATKIAYISFNDTAVELSTMKRFSKEVEDEKRRELKFRYPKAGSTNPEVSVFVQELRPDGVNENIKVRPPPEVVNIDHYVCSVGWVSDSSLAILYQNRLQNISFTTLCSHPTYHCKKIHVEQSETGWVENRGLPKFNADLSGMVLVESVDEGETGSYPQLVW